MVKVHCGRARELSGRITTAPKGPSIRLKEKRVLTQKQSIEQHTNKKKSAPQPSGQLLFY